MELRICCDASVKLEKMTNVNEIFCDIDSYKVKGDTLEGNIRIQGNFIKDDMNIHYDFNELVPFTIVFKDKNFQINKIEVQEFDCQEIINQGIECQFDILVDYTPKKMDEVPEEIEEIGAKEEIGEIVAEEEIEDIGKEEKIVEIKEVEEEPMPKPQVEEIPFEEESESVPVMDSEMDVIAVSDEAIKAEINQKYNELLNEILEARADDNFFEPETEKAIMIHSDESRDDCRGFLTSIKNDFKSVKVYYTNKEADIEQICRNERVSVDKVYRDNQKSDFINKRRIIIK
jgi:hypothetical protein